MVITEPSGYEMMILRGLQTKQHLYAGTVEPAQIDRRRARNKVARISRRINRQRAR